MTSGEKVTAKQMHQICVVVRDIQAAVERYWNLFGIGPWQFYTFKAPELTEPMIHGKPQPYSMRIAVAYIGEVQWELIQPLTGPSIYQEFLDERGEGVHHVALGVDHYDDTIAAMKKEDVDVLMSGCWNGVEYGYLDSEKNLGVIVELFKYPAEFVMPEPEATYPPTA